MYYVSQDLKIEFYRKGEWFISDSPEILQETFKFRKSFTSNDLYLYRYIPIVCKQCHNNLQTIPIVRLLEEVVTFPKVKRHFSFDKMI